MVYSNLYKNNLTGHLMTVGTKNTNADFKMAKEKANQTLEENLIIEPPVKVIELVKNYGYEVEEAELPPTVAGFVDPVKHVIYVNMTDSPQRKAFTVAHELGHIKMHLQDLRSNPDLGVLFRKPLGKKDEDAKEQEANCFAANLLVPEEMLKSKRNEYKDLATFENLALLFGVSKEVITYRINDLNHNQSNG